MTEVSGDTCLRHSWALLPLQENIMNIIEAAFASADWPEEVSRACFGHVPFTAREDALRHSIVLAAGEARSLTGGAPYTPFSTFWLTGLNSRTLHDACEAVRERDRHLPELMLLVLFFEGRFLDASQPLAGLTSFGPSDLACRADFCHSILLEELTRAGVTKSDSRSVFDAEKTWRRGPNFSAYAAATRMERGEA